MEPNELANRLRRSIKQRRVIQPSGSSFKELTVELEMSPPLESQLVGRVLIEGVAASNEAVDGMIRIRRVDVQPDLVKVVLDALPAEATRLDVLLEVFRRRKLPVSPTWALSIVGEIARTLGHLGSTSRGASHGYLSEQTVLIDRNGGITLIGAARSLIVAMLAPPAPKEDEHLFTLAPEAARGERRTAQTDVYALGALYYRLLSGASYRSELSVDEGNLAAVDGRAPSLPGQLTGASDQLLAILKTCLAPAKKDRFPDVQAMLAASLEPATVSARAISIDEKIARVAMQSPAVLFGAEEPQLHLIEETETLPAFAPIEPVASEPDAQVWIAPPQLDAGGAEDTESKVPVPRFASIEIDIEAERVEAAPQPIAPRTAPLPLDTVPTEVEFPAIKLVPTERPVSGIESLPPAPEPPPAPIAKQVIDERRTRHRALPPNASSSRAPARSAGRVEKIRWVPVTERGPTVASAQSSTAALETTKSASDHPEVDHAPPKSNRTFGVLLVLMVLAVLTAAVFALRERTTFEVAPANNILKIQVESIPPGAVVKLDGERLGTTPLAVERGLGTGVYAIEVSAEGYMTFTSAIRASEANDGVLALSVKLAR